MSETTEREPPSEIVTTDGELTWDDLGGLFERLHQEFFPVFGPAPSWSGPRAPTLPAAATDIEDTGDAYELRADLPGFSKEQVDVRVQGRLVHVKAEQSKAAETKPAHTYLRRERSYRGFERSVQLPEPVAGDQVKATFENGVLHLTIPKAHPVSEHKVEIA